MKSSLHRKQFTNNYSSMKRKSKEKYGMMPVRVQNFHDDRNQLIRSLQSYAENKKLQPLNMSMKRQTSDKKANFSNFNSTIASTFNITKRLSQRVMSSDQNFRSTSRSILFSNQEPQKIDYRPSTQFKTHRNFQIKQRLLISTPLQVINSKISSDQEREKELTYLLSSRLLKNRKSCHQNYVGSSSSQENFKQKKKFLKKGSSFDRTLLHNILKSKLRQKLVQNPQNYSNFLPNHSLFSKVKRRIPNQFRDIIGPQETLRMSKILTGIDIKSVDMDRKIQEAINLKRIKNRGKTIDSNNDDNQTLKSIKRW